ncbi:MAG TPA: heparan-alpha-glucosaminide N-acetyltransferase domain-containing protein [Flavitalea sp.]|nr:heparan-alpha-glucosaminide N-acetyltransferase domain-containing protein [Flavitalea sp.]
MPAQRIASIDKLRGLVMIIMALDHVRDFFHVTAQTADPLDLATTTPALFFTRWITHFCAPVFVFLSGTSAFLSAKNKPSTTASMFLVKRGAWLAVADILLVTLMLTFNPGYNFIMLTVFWAIGISMIVLGLLTRFAARLILPLGLILFFGHDLITPIPFSNNAGGALMKVMFQGLFIVPLNANHIVAFLYPVLPWTAVMLLGYSFGKIVSDQRKVFVCAVGFVILFLIFRSINLYGDSLPWSGQDTAFKTFLSFINTSKYPPSLQFLCMTLGPALLMLYFFQLSERGVNSRNLLIVYGRTPFFYFVLHLFLAHLLLVAFFFASGHSAAEIADPASPMLFRPKNFGFSLPVVYACWLIVVAALYFPCRWYYRYKREHRYWWLSYL